MKIFAIDIDGTLTIETDGWKYSERTPNLKRIRGVNKLYNEGHRIVLFTARYAVDKEITEQWLELHGVLYHELILGKIQYDAIIDDRSLPLEFLET